MHVDVQDRLLPNPFLVALDQRELRVRTYRRRYGGRQQVSVQERPREGHRRVYVPRREDVVEALNERGMLPAIYFVFSRVGCDRSVEYLMDAGLRLTTPDEELAILESRIRYEGYIRREQDRLERLKPLESRRIPDGFDYREIPGLSREVVEKCSRRRPRTVGEAGRIPGVTPAAVAIICAHAARERANETSSL